MPPEIPGAYDEARKRIRETKEQETAIIEKKKEDFEKGKEKIYSKKKLDIFELKRRIETGQSLSTLKSDVRSALESGQISIDNYTDVLRILEHTDEKHEEDRIQSDYILAPGAYPFSDAPLTQYFESKKLGENLLIDMAGFVYGFAQGSVFLLWLLGRIVLDTILLPRDVLRMIQK